MLYSQDMAKLEERIKRASKTRQVVNHNPPPAAAEPPPSAKTAGEVTGTHQDLAQGSDLPGLLVSGKTS